MAVTAKRDNMRLIAIVLGEDSVKVRNQETMELLDYGFNLYKVDLIKSKDDRVGSTKIDKSSKDSIDVYPKEDITILGKKSDASLNCDIEVKLNDINLPVKKDSVIGKIVVKSGNKNIKEVDAIVREDIDKMNFLQTLGNTLRDLLTGELF